jgi:hypothetical protein
MQHRIFASAARRAGAWAVLSAAALLAGACASNSQLVNMWHDPQASPRPLNNVMVVAIRRNETMRRVWEDTFVRALQERGVTAVPSYRLYADHAPDTSEVADAARNSRFDGVIAIHPLGTSTTEHYVPGYTTLEPVSRHNPWTGWYHTYYTDVYNPGYVETEQVVRYQVDVFSADENGQLVWSGITETIDPRSDVAVNREISRLIVPELAHAGIVTNNHH